MRLLLLTEYFAPHAGGTAVHYYEICRRLREVDVTVVARAHPGAAAFDCKQTFAIIRTPFPPIPKIRMIVEVWAQFLIGLRLALCRRIDVIHAGQVFPLGLAACTIHLLTRVPYALYIWGEEISIALRYRWMWAAVILVLRHADAVFVGSGRTATQIARLGVPAHRIHVVRPGVDPTEFQPVDGSALRTELGANGRRLLLTVGRLVPRKGFDTVIRLLPQIAVAIPNVVYWIAGGGSKIEYQSLQRQAVSAGVADRVRFLGEISHTQLPALYSACDVFVMLNRTMPDGDFEGFGIVFLEASACGKPVVGGRSGGAVEAVEDGQTGFLIPEGDDTAAVAAIVGLLSDAELRTRFGEAGRLRAMRHFSWEQAAHRVAQVTAALTQRAEIRADVVCKERLPDGREE